MHYLLVMSIRIVLSSLLTPVSTQLMVESNNIIVNLTLGCVHTVLHPILYSHQGGHVKVNHYYLMAIRILY